MTSILQEKIVWQLHNVADVFFKFGSNGRTNNSDFIGPSFPSGEPGLKYNG